MTDAQEALAAMKAKKAVQDASAEKTASNVAAEAPEVLDAAAEGLAVPDPEVEEPEIVVQEEIKVPTEKDPTVKDYHSYTSARISTCLVTPGGIRINFTDYAYYTKDPIIIAYLDGEIANGCKAIKAGDRISADEINPAAALKRKTIEDFKASQEGRDFSSQYQMKKLIEDGKISGAGTGMLNTDGVAN